MNITWKYNLLFSFTIQINGELTNGGFGIIPTSECKDLLEKKRLIFRPNDKGASVYAENRVYDDSSTEPISKFTQLVAFTFILKLKNFSLMNNLSPFNSVLPDFYGRRRILYFDNLDDALNIDANLMEVTTPSLNLSSLNLASNEIAVSQQDMASLMPNRWQYRKTSGINSLRLTPIHPGADHISRDLSDKPIAKLDLINAAYRLEQVGSTVIPEVIYSNSSLLSQGVFGVIQIYKDSATDLNQAIRYDINFDES